MMDTLLHHFDAPLFLLALPLLWACAHWVRTRRPRPKGTMLLPGASRLKQLSRGPMVRLFPWLGPLRLASISLALVALARPVGWRSETIQMEGLDLVVALDMSGSMRAVDVTQRELAAIQARGQEPNDRITIAIEVLQDFIAARTNDRIGLVVFGRDAYTLFPLTLDTNTTQDMVGRLKLGDIDPNGTAIGNALGRSVALLRDSEAETRAIILITDGDNRGGNITPMQASQIAADQGIIVFPILVGTEDLALEPMGHDFFGQHLRYRRSNYPADPEALEQIAISTGGQYFNASDSKTLKGDFQKILDSLQRSEMEDLVSAARVELCSFFLFPALLFLFLEFWLRMTLMRKFP